MDLEASKESLKESERHSEGQEITFVFNAAAVVILSHPVGIEQFTQIF